MKTKILLGLCLALGLNSAASAAESVNVQALKKTDLIKEKAPLETDASVQLQEFTGSGISLKYPVGWELIQDIPKPRVVHVKTLGGKVNASMTVQDLPSGFTLDQYKEATARDIERDAKQLNPKKLLEEQSHLGNMPAWKVIFSITIPGVDPPLSAKQTLYVSVNSNKGYLLCCTAFDILPSKFDTVFQAIAESVTLTENKMAPPPPGLESDQAVEQKRI